MRAWARGAPTRMTRRVDARRVMQRIRADLVLIVLDVAFLSLAMAWALLLRFDGEVPAQYWDGGYRRLLPLCVVFLLIANSACGLYGQVWRHASVVEARRVLLSAGLFGLALFAIDGIENRAIPWSVLLTTLLIQTILAAGVRFYSRLFGTRRVIPIATVARRVVVVGAGEAGAALVRDMLRSARWATRPLLPVAMLDDNVRLHGHACLGVPVVGPLAQLPEVVTATQADQVVLAIPSARQETVQRVADLAKSAQTALRVLPGVAQLVRQRVSIDDLRELRIDDLVGRQQVVTDLDAVCKLLLGQRVLVTGAGGSIGSELVRQIACCGPAEIIALDHDETHLHDLAETVSSGGLKQVLADIRDRAMIREIFMRYTPDVVFHAAAHKHVPVLEHYPCEAIRTNVLGTENVVSAARTVGTNCFVYISTDKAVRPSSVMGATKRLGEQIALSGSIGARLCAVRFGNVLGSRGSVVPTFLRQIEAGGPVTVTDPRMARFFMNIPEAVQLVLQAAALAEGGEVFTLDMGKPVRIVDLAERMIQLSGRRDANEIRIEFTGMRAGEKLIEELHAPEEATGPTPHPSIVRLRPHLLGEAPLADALAELRLLTRRMDETAARDLLFTTVETLATGCPSVRADFFTQTCPADSVDDAIRDSEEARQWTPSAS